MEARQRGCQIEREGREEEAGAASADDAQVKDRGREEAQEGADRGVQVQEGVGEAEGKID